MVLEVSARKAEPGSPLAESHRLMFIDLVLPSAAKLDKIDSAFLNKSLLSLLKCVSVLGKGSKDAYVPFRDSLLTKLMRDHIVHNENTICLGGISTLGVVEDNLKVLDFLSKLSQLRIRRLTSAQAEHNLTPSQFKELISDLEGEKHRLQQLVSEETVTVQPCDCESKIAAERRAIDEGNVAVRLILGEKLNYLKSANEARYVHELHANDLMKRRAEFMERTLNESCHFAARGGNVEDFIREQDVRFKRECAQLEKVIAKNYESTWVEQAAGG